MAEFIQQFGGLAIAILGAGLAVGLCCIGSARGTGMVGEAATGLLSQNPENFAQCLILQVIPGTQGLYGLVIGFFALNVMGAFSGGIPNIDLPTGFAVALSCLPMAIGGYRSAIYQGRVASGGINIVAKQPASGSQGIILSVVVEFYAILSLLISILFLMNIPGLG